MDTQIGSLAGAVDGVTVDLEIGSQRILGLKLPVHRRVDFPTQRRDEGRGDRFPLRRDDVVGQGHRGEIQSVGNLHGKAQPPLDRSHAAALLIADNDVELVEPGRKGELLLEIDVTGHAFPFAAKIPVDRFLEFMDHPPPQCGDGSVQLDGGAARAVSQVLVGQLRARNDDGDGHQEGLRVQHLVGIDHLQGELVVGDPRHHRGPEILELDLGRPLGLEIGFQHQEGIR